MKITFVEAAAAKAFMKQHQRTPIRLKATDPPLQMCYIADEATRVLRFSLPLPDSAGLPPMLHSLGGEDLPSATPKGSALCSDQLEHFCSKKEAMYLRNLGFCDMLGVDVLEVSREKPKYQEPMKLVVEFLSIEAAVRVKGKMEGDERWNGSVCEFGLDPCGGLVDGDGVEEIEAEDDEAVENQAIPKDGTESELIRMDSLHLGDVYRKCTSSNCSIAPGDSFSVAGDKWTEGWDEL